MSDNRNYGLDLLRILSMFMVVVLHVLGNGGAMVRISGQESTYYAAWFLETCAYGAVNLYGLLSGYVGAGSKWRPGRILELWLQVFFYSAGITVLYRIFAPELLLDDSLWKAVFPISWKTYWYFSSYTGVFFLMPYLNKMVDSLEEKERKRLAVTLFLVFSVFTALPKANGSDFLQLVGGYSFVWLLILYLCGACIRKCTFHRWKKRWYLLSYLGLITFSWGFKIVVENYTRRIFGEARFGRVFTGYAAPTIFLGAVCLFLVFEGVKFRSKIWKRVISIASPLAFSVYLIHTHPLIWEHMLKGAFSSFRYYSAVRILPAVLLAAAAIYLSCSLADQVRKQLFRLLKVKERSERIGNRIFFGKKS